MTDKEFKRLSRSQLIDIIYQLQLNLEELTRENQKLSEALADKRIRITQAGNIADAALEINNVMQSVQNAAQQYLEEIRMMRQETEAECRDILKKAREEAQALSAQTENNRDFAGAIKAEEEILQQ